MINAAKVINWIANVLTGILLAYTCIYESISGGWVVSFSLAVVVFLLRDRGKVELYCDPYVILNVLMILYVAVSSLWAWDSSTSIGTARSMLINFFITVMLYFAYDGENGSWEFMNALKWGGYFLAVYQIGHYGFSRLRTMLLEAERITNEAGNANVLGMAIAFSCLFEFLVMAKKKHISLSGFFVIPSFIFIAATQSRKAFLLLLIGSVLIYLYYFMDRKQIFRSLFAVMTLAGIVYIISTNMSESKVLSGVMKRMEGLVAGFTGEGDADASTNVRQAMITAGWNQFLKTPVLGIGINNTRFLLIQENVFEGYSHNNYIELLCGGGIIGALIYYARYIFLMIYLFIHVKERRETFFPCAVFVLLTLILDYGKVSYNILSEQLRCALFFLLIEDNQKQRGIQTIQRYKYVKEYDKADMRQLIRKENQTC